MGTGIALCPYCLLLSTIREGVSAGKAGKSCVGILFHRRERLDNGSIGVRGRPGNMGRYVIEEELCCTGLRLCRLYVKRLRGS